MRSIARLEGSLRTSVLSSTRTHQASRTRATHEYLASVLIAGSLPRPRDPVHPISIRGRRIVFPSACCRRRFPIPRDRDEGKPLPSRTVFRPDSMYSRMSAGVFGLTTVRRQMSERGRPRSARRNDRCHRLEANRSALENDWLQARRAAHVRPAGIATIGCSRWNPVACGTRRNSEQLPARTIRRGK